MRKSGRLVSRLHRIGLLALGGAALVPSTLAFGDAAELGAMKLAPQERWLSHFAPADPRPAITIAALDAFDPAWTSGAAAPQGFVIRQAEPEEVSPAPVKAQHERAALPPRLAARFAIAVSADDIRFETMTVHGAYAEPSPEVASSGSTFTGFTMAPPSDGATPSAEVRMASLTPFEQMPATLVAKAPVLPDADAEDRSAAEMASLNLSPGEDLDKARKCLAEAVYFEARSESEKGQYAVAQVVMNRTRTGFYPATVCGVVYENKHRRNACQFSFACDGKPDKVRDKKSWITAQRIADDVLLNGAYLSDVGTSTHYHATYVRPRWIRDMTDRHRIGTHVFYRVKAWSDEGV